MLTKTYSQLLLSKPLFRSNQVRTVSKKGLDDLFTRQGPDHHQLVPQANPNRTNLMETVQWYVPFIPRPQVCINDNFMKKIVAKDGDSDIKRKTKEELTKYFEPYYGNKFDNPYNHHVLVGTIVRCASISLLFGIPGEIAITCGTIWSLCVGATYSGTFDDNKANETMRTNLSRYRNLFKDEE